MPAPSLSADELLAWNEHTTQTLRTLIEQHPEILQLECDIYNTKTVAELLRHIVAVETRFAQRLAGVEESPYDAIPYSSAAEIFAVHDTALAGLRAELAKDDDWDRKLEFQTISLGRLRAPRKALLFHALLHSIRHYAQLATLLRQHGFAPGRQLDYLIMGVEPAS